MQKIVTFLTYDNQAEAALTHYLSVFRDSKIIDKIPGPNGGLLGATIEIFGQQFIVLNGGPHFTFAPGISLFVKCETQEEIDELWEKLSEGGQKQPCGWLQDKFGVSWQIIPPILGEMLGDKDPLKSKRVMEAMLQMSKINIAELKAAYASD